MIIKDDQKYFVRLVNLQNGKFAERAISDGALIVLRRIELRGVIQILDVSELGGIRMINISYADHTALCMDCLTSKKLKEIQIGDMCIFVLCESCMAELSIEIERELVE